MAVEVSVGAMKNFSVPIVAVWFVLDTSSIQVKIYLWLHALGKKYIRIHSLLKYKEEKITTFKSINVFSIIIQSSAYLKQEFYQCSKRY